MKNTPGVWGHRPHEKEPISPAYIYNIIAFSNVLFTQWRVPKKNGFRGGREREARSVSGFFGRPK